MPADPEDPCLLVRCVKNSRWFVGSTVGLELILERCSQNLSAIIVSVTNQLGYFGPNILEAVLTNDVDPRVIVNVDKGMSRAESKVSISSLVIVRLAFQSV